MQRAYLLTYNINCFTTRTNICTSYKPCFHEQIFQRDSLFFLLSDTGQLTISLMKTHGSTNTQMTKQGCYDKHTSVLCRLGFLLAAALSLNIRFPDE